MQKVFGDKGGKSLKKGSCTTKTLFCTGATQYFTGAKGIWPDCTQRPFALPPNHFGAIFLKPAICQDYSFPSRDCFFFKARALRDLEKVLRDMGGGVSLVAACLATGDRIFATGSNSVSKIVLRSCGCSFLI